MTVTTDFPILAAGDIAGGQFWALESSPGVPILPFTNDGGTSGSTNPWIGGVGNAGIYNLYGSRLTASKDRDGAATRVIFDQSFTRFYTAAIGALGAIVSAEVHLTYRTQINGAHAFGAEWLTGGGWNGGYPIPTDASHIPVVTAVAEAATPHAANDVLVLPVLDLTGINKTGYSRLRWHLNEAFPSTAGISDNFYIFDGWGQAGVLFLRVTYTPGPTLPPQCVDRP